MESVKRCDESNSISICNVYHLLNGLEWNFNLYSLNDINTTHDAPTKRAGHMTPSPPFHSDNKVKPEYKVHIPDILIYMHYTKLMLPLCYGKDAHSNENGRAGDPAPASVGEVRPRRARGHLKIT